MLNKKYLINTSPFSPHSTFQIHLSNERSAQQQKTTRQLLDKLVLDQEAALAELRTEMQATAKQVFYPSRPYY